jgi:hypothetical protein
MPARGTSHGFRGGASGAADTEKVGGGVTRKTGAAGSSGGDTTGRSVDLRVTLEVSEASEPSGATPVCIPMSN